MYIRLNFTVVTSHFRMVPEVIWSLGLTFSKFTYIYIMTLCFRMAPEVIMCETLKDNPYNFKADIWSLGLIFYCIYFYHFKFFEIKFLEISYFTERIQILCAMQIT